MLQPTPPSCLLIHREVIQTNLLLYPSRKRKQLQLNHVKSHPFQFHSIGHSKKPPHMLIGVFTRMPSKLILVEHGDECKLKLKIVCCNCRLPDCRIIISNNRPPKAFYSSLSLRSVNYHNRNVFLSSSAMP